MSEEKVEVEFGAGIDGLVAGVVEVKEQMEGLAGFTQGIMSTFRELSEAMAAVFAVEQIEGFIEKISDLGSKVETASAQLGLSVEKIQGIDYAARISDAGIDQATRTIDRFYQSVQEAEEPTSRQAAAFEAMGINVRKFLADGGTLEELLEKTTAQLGQYADGANKSVLIMDLFGQRSAETVRLINSLSEGIDKLSDVQQSLSAPTEKTLQQLQEMHVRMTDLHTTFENWSQDFASISLLAVRAGEGFVEFLSIVKSVFDGLGILLATALSEVKDWGVGVAAVFKGVADRSLTEMEQAYSRTFKNMKADAADAGIAIDTLVDKEKKLIAEMENPAMKGVGTDKTGAKAPVPPTKKKKGGDHQVADWQAELDQMLLAQQLFGDKAKTFELQSWQQKLTLAKHGTQEYDDIIQKIYALESANYSRDVDNFVAALNAKQAAVKNNWTQFQAIERQKLAYLKQIYGQDSTQYQAELRRQEEMDRQHVLQTEQKYKQMFGSIFSSFNSAIEGMLKGTETFQQAVSEVFWGLADALASVLEKMAANWLAEQLIGKASTEATATSNIAASAAQAGAAAYASTAAIPIIGPELAPAAAAAAYAGSIAYEGMASFDVGAWNIDSDQIAKIHKGEMVVPAGTAEKWRDGATPGGGDTHNHFHVQTIDGRGFARWLNNNGPAIAKSLKGQARNFNPDLTGMRV